MEKKIRCFDLVIDAKGEPFLKEDEDYICFELGGFEE